MNNDNDQWMRRYLDGELDGGEESRALHMIADDPELRAMLKFELQLRQDLPNEHRNHGLSEASIESMVARADLEPFHEGVMHEIAGKEQSSTREAHDTTSGERPLPTGGPIPRIIGAWNRLTQPRQIVWQPAWSAGIAALLLLLVLSVPYLLTQTDDPVTTTEVPVRQIVDETSSRVMMRFVYIDNEAESVAVAGDFSDWEPISLNRQTINGDIAWTGIVPLPRGEHHYMFIKDDEQWATDPLAHRHVDDGFGNKNAVINL